MNLSGNTILITGGTSGIGRAFAEKYFQAGSTVIICGRREDRLNQMTEQFPGMISRVCDVSIAAQREELLKWIIHTHPETNILLNNAGIQLATNLQKPVNLGHVYAEVETNFIAPIHLASLFSEHLSTKQSSAIINISSGLAFVPIAFMPVYCATKAAIHSFTLSLRHQLRNTSIKVFEIAPPSVDTELGHERRADKTQSHGGMPVADFITEAMQAIHDDKFEAPIAQAKDLHSKREAMFHPMNSRFE